MVKGMKMKLILIYIITTFVVIYNLITNIDNIIQAESLLKEVYVMFNVTKYSNNYINEVFTTFINFIFNINIKNPITYFIGW